MDQFAPELLNNVYQYLPWKDRLAARQLSSKFNSLLPYLISMITLKIEQNKNTVSFQMIPKKSSNEPIETIEIIKATQRIDFVFSKTSSVEDGRRVRKMTIRCTRPNFYRFIDVYMEFLVSVYHFKHLKLININGSLLAKFCNSYKRFHPDFWKNEKPYIYQETGWRTVTAEQRKFMNLCKKPASFCLSPSSDFQLPTDFWEVPAIAGTKQLFLSFGMPILHCTIDKVSDVDVGVDDDFFRQLIEKKQTNFVVNGLASISSNCIKEYITNCLNGGHAFYTFRVSHKYTTQQLQDIKDHLLLCGFSEDDGAFVAVLGELKGLETRELTVVLHPKTIIIMAGSFVEKARNDRIRVDYV